MDYKDTLNLPKTAFPMRANLPQNEPRQVEKWDHERTYFQALEANAQQRTFILHDGPPYANGNIHIGHALNKILKDIIVKYQSMTGHAAPYVPGWDCHGLPIELQVEKNLGRAKKLAMSKAEIRRLCKEYAEKYISIQRDEFRNILGNQIMVLHRRDRQIHPNHVSHFTRPQPRGIDHMLGSDSPLLRHNFPLTIAFLMHFQYTILQNNFPAAFARRA